MRICFIGTGYVGLVSGTCFAETGNDVICMDIERDRISALKEGRVPIFEPGLEEMVRRNLKEGRLAFTTDLVEAVKESLVVFIAVGTPAEEDGSPDLCYVMNAARGVAQAMGGYKIVVIKSTVPVGTADRVEELIASLTRFKFDVVSNPEFLKEGAAVDDFMKPDRVVVGTREVRVAEMVKELYSPFTRTGAPIIIMDTRSAEMTKYAANAMLASRISFMNEIANLCEHVGADVHWVRQGLGSDRRIGSSFLFPGVGYGGSCFPKDVAALMSLARRHDYPLKLVTAIQSVNQLQKQVLINKILKFYSSDLPSLLEQRREPPRESEALSADNGITAIHEVAGESAEMAYDQMLALDRDKLPNMAFGEGNQLLQSVTLPEGRPSPVQGRTFALWGLSFKPQTSDMREAPSLAVIDRLLELGARIQAYDPEAMEEARKTYGDRIVYTKTNYAALENADALILLTEWNVFRNPDFSKMKTLLKHAVVFDGRNQYNPQEMRQLGFLYFGIGRP
ncbi:MAG: UDP-glucose dehydrogenase family protein [Acidobacteriota bacterium]